MTTTAEEIEANVAAALEAAGITYEAHHVALVDRDWGDSKPHKMDQWSLTFLKGGAAFRQDYFTGLGHRKFPKGTFIDKRLTVNTLAWHAQEACKKPVKPLPGSYLYCLCMDASAADMSFNDWCGELGYASDSIKAFNTYQACCSIAREAQTFFGRKLMADLCEMVRDY